MGLFGFSAGGFTGLVIAGGEPDMTRGVQHCRDYTAVLHLLGQVEQVCTEPDAFDRVAFKQSFNTSVVGFFRRSFQAEVP